MNDQVMLVKLALWTRFFIIFSRKENVNAEGKPYAVVVINKANYMQ